ncbi:hypothetical protein ACMU_19050 [Actibacterium mucosum KCTC 23349]|uniref:DUF1330 domain-containing protein n=1 Tax=Actibacterium mucosum KCTC 23349 TaxID=1454373 RepID=A0A037ZDW7_9RHOB|nr:DUF1330 domain-containing protein [Actibacterium mucosum]KAJ54322.1 hypothetical protein ACMU_19050 [Actibacterium mucosum KCTC 23349]
MTKFLTSAALGLALIAAPAAQAEPVFLLAQSNVTDADAFFGQYGPAAFATLQEHGATIYFGAQDYTAIEGDWTGNWTALVSFPDEDAAMAWYNSDAYQSGARPIRLSATDDGMLVLFRPVSAN